MIAASEKLSVSLPSHLVEELERVRKEEHRTRSEVVQKALQQYIGREAELRRVRKRIKALPEEEATIQEVEAIEEGRRAFRKGEFVTLDQLRHGMGHYRQQSRRKKSRARSSR